MKIVFMGTPEFAAHHLQFLLDQQFPVVGVVTQPPRPKGRSQRPSPSEVAGIAQKHHLPLIETSQPSKPEPFSQIQALAPDLIVLVAYGALLRTDLLLLPPLGCINVHPSLLPKYRGAAPLRRAMMAGEQETGVCIMEMVKELDAGDLLEKEVIPIPPEMTYGELEKEVEKVSTKLLAIAIQKIEKGEAIRTPQETEGITYAKKIESADCEIDFSRPARELHNLIRALSPEPGAWCSILVKEVPKRLKIFRTRVVESVHQGVRQGAWIVPCGEGNLELCEVQLEGKGRMRGEELLRGLSLASIRFLI
ncbi:MAG: methionyl-tRNA formyltransferase [Verrucomicrobia bacterium]|nr:methionyl-tRNA formyltransferase [Verrucomicrobiota bacterium]